MMKKNANDLFFLSFFTGKNPKYFQYEISIMEY